MSFKFYKSATSRLQRSELAVPGSSPKMFEKALNSNADYIFLDLEDAVSPNDKISARHNVIKALKEINWREKGKTISVRINSLDTHYMYSDIVELVEQVGDKIQRMLIAVTRAVDAGNMVVFGADRQALRALADKKEVEGNYIMSKKLDVQFTYQ